MDKCSFQMRLGCQLCRYFTCSASGEDLGQQGPHHMSCSENASQYFRHAEVNYVIKKHRLV